MEVTGESMGMGVSTSKRTGWSLIQADARALPLADESVQCVCTSSPYWNLRDYDLPKTVWGGRDDCPHEWAEHLQPAANGIIHEGGMSGETLSSNSATRKAKKSSFCQKCGAWLGCLGLEPTPELFIRNMVLVFREVRRVLRKDGTVFLNLGDSYAGGGRGGNPGDSPHIKQKTNRGSLCGAWNIPTGLKPKDQCLIPHRVALALQADGWWVRDTIIWHKPNPMPSSVTDRTTTAHEYIFLLTKSARYFFDADAIREPITSTGGAVFGGAVKGAALREQGIRIQGRRVEDPADRNHPLGRNKRSVWAIATQSFHGAHFATFPVKLIEPCILAGTSEKGCCPKCGACWKRVVERVREPRRDAFGRKDVGEHDHGQAGAPYMEVVAATSIWIPGCKCHAGDPIPCTVLDIFNGAATTGIAATKHGRRYIGIDRKAEYLEMSRKRLTEYKERPQKPQRRTTTKTSEPDCLFGPSFSEGGQP